MFCAHSKRIWSLKKKKVIAEWHIVHAIIHFFSCLKKKNLLFLIVCEGIFSTLDDVTVP